MIKLIIFDFDDTLVNNHYLDCKSFEISFKKYSIKSPSKQEIKKFRKKGFTAKYIIKNNLKKMNLIESYDKIMNERERFLENDNTEYLILQDHICEILEFIKMKNIKIMLITANKNKKTVLKFLNKKKLTKYFSKILFVNDLDIWLDNSNIVNRILIKSSLLYKIFKNLKISKNEILYIGNSSEDFDSCKDFKINFIHYQNDYLPQLVNSKFDSINSMSDLKNILGEKNK